MKARIVLKGGKGSGNFGHSGRPGKVGGSGGGKGTSRTIAQIDSSTEARLKAKGDDVLEQLDDVLYQIQSEMSEYTAPGAKAMYRSAVNNNVNLRTNSFNRSGAMNTIKRYFNDFDDTDRLRYSALRRSMEAGVRAIDWHVNDINSKVSGWNSPGARLKFLEQVKI